MNQDLQPKRMMNEAVAIEQSRNLNSESRTFKEGMVTQEDVVMEMRNTIMRCTPCEIKNK